MCCLDELISENLTLPVNHEMVPEIIRSYSHGRFLLCFVEENISVRPLPTLLEELKMRATVVCAKT
jgi:hypothetical protein